MSSASADIFKAQELLANKNYQEALKEYEESAAVGSPHAYYHLGFLYHKGLGVEQDSLKALMWFSLAADFQFKNSLQIKDKLAAALPESMHDDVQKMLSSYQAIYGEEAIQNNYYPDVISENLQSRITFEGKKSLEKEFQSADDFFVDDFLFDGEEVNADSGQGSFGNVGSLSLIEAERANLLVVDYDVGPDGSIRHLSPIQQIGTVMKLTTDFKKHILPSPTFADNKVNFINRTSMGIANYSRFDMSERESYIYNRIRRSSKQLQNSDKIDDQYKYAMMLLNFSWLSRDKNKALDLMEDLAEAGYPLAQYEFGLSLYRDQVDIEKSIYWLSEASKYGLEHAEYRLGRILQDSPWVVNDEKKAMFWYDMASSKQYEPAIFKAIELKLLAKDETLRNQPEAITMLASLKDKRENDPLYQYLFAVSHLRGENRNLPIMINHMRKAILLAGQLNWDTSNWQNQLLTWTTGSVSISNESH